MYGLLVLSFSVLLALPAQAQELEVRALCDTEAISGPDYVPGVDVYGNEVVAADINESSPEPLVYPVVVPVSIDSIKWLGLYSDDDVSQQALEGQVKMGTIKIFEDGRAEYNGQDISDRTRIFCAGDSEETGGIKTKKGDIDVEVLGTPETNKESHGQE